MNRKLNVAIVGAGLMGKWHAHYAKQLKTNLVAIIDNNISQAQLLVDLYPTAKAYSEVNFAFEEQSIDVVHICTPLTSHYQLVKQAIEQGLHVIVEKPLAFDSKETTELLESAKQNKVMLCSVHQFCWQTSFQKMIKYNKLGDISQLNFVTCSAGAENLAVENYHEVIADILPHPLSLFRSMYPDMVMAELDWQCISAKAGELILNVQNKAVSFAIYISLNNRPTRCEMTLFGSLGTTTLNFFHGFAITESGAATRLQKVLQPFKLAVQLLLTASLNLIARFYRRENAYPGLKNLLSNIYHSIQNSNFQLESHEMLMDIANTRDKLIKNIIPSTINFKD